MSQTNNNSATASTGFSWLGLLGVLFVAAKIADGAGYENPVGDWSWWLVLLPFYLGIVIILVVLAVLGSGYLVAKKVEGHKAKKRRKERENRYPTRPRDANTYRRYDGP